MRRGPGGIATRIALAALVVAGIALAILALGVGVIGAQRFSELMAEHGQSVEASAAMFQESVVTVVGVAAVVAILVALVLAAIVGSRLARPLREVGTAARRIARGDYAARIPRSGPEEIASLADSFNQMAAALEDQERIRREFIANAAHELRTPLTNLKGYLEALRDGVIAPDRDTLDFTLGGGGAPRAPVPLARHVVVGRHRAERLDRGARSRACHPIGRRGRPPAHAVGRSRSRGRRPPTAGGPR